MTASALSALAPAPTRHRSTGLILAVASALAFSSSGPLVKPLLEAGWSLGAALTVRMGVAGLILAPALIRALRHERGFLRRHGALIAGFGLTGVMGCQLFFFSAMQRMPVAVALLIQYVAPVLIVIWVWVRTRRRPSRLVLLGTVVAMTGLVLVVDISGARFDALGTVLALCAAVCAAAYFVISERAGDDLPPLALAAGGLLLGAVVMVVLGLTGILPFRAPAVSIEVAGVTVPWFVPLLWVAMASTAVGYAFGVMAVPRIGSRLASFVGLSEVLFALGFAWLLLGETPGAVQFVGGALVLAGVVAVRLDADVTGATAAPAVPVP
ncbi:EamA family transporter [Microbacterium aureliae]